MDELFSWRSPSARDYRDRRDDLSEDDLLDLMMAEPRLIRRPLTIRVDDQNRYVAGARAADLAALAAE